MLKKLALWLVIFAGLLSAIGIVACDMAEFKDTADLFLRVTMCALVALFAGKISINS